MSNTAGWYRDPYGDELRWWDGVRWTDWVTDDPSEPTAPPIPTAPTAPVSVPRTPDAAPMPEHSLDSSDAILHRAKTHGIFAGVEAGVGAPASSRPSTSSRPAKVAASTRATATGVSPSIAPAAGVSPSVPPPAVPPPPGWQPPPPVSATTVGPAQPTYRPLRTRRGSTPGSVGVPALRNLVRWIAIGAFIVFSVGSCLLRDTNDASQSESVVDPGFPPSDPAWDLEVQRACELGRADPLVPSNDLMEWNGAWVDEHLWRIELVNEIDRCIGSVAPPTTGGADCGPVEPASLLVGPERFVGACVTMVVEVTQRGSADPCLFHGVWDNPDRGMSEETRGPESWFWIDDTPELCGALMPLANPGQRIAVVASVDGAHALGEHRGATVPLPLFVVTSAAPQS